MRVRYILNGQDCNPVKRENIFLEVNHDQGGIINQDLPHVGVRNLYFAREDIKNIMAYLDNPPGITEGIPFDIVITEKNQTETINLYLDLMEDFEASKDGIQASVKMLQSLDWLDDKVQFTFESLYNKTGVASFKIDGITYTSYQDYFDKRCIFIPYVISTIPNFQSAFMAFFATVQISIELTRAGKDLSQLIASTLNPFEATSVARLVLEMLFVTFLLAALVAVLIQLINCLIQPVKYHGAMLIVDLLKIIAQSIGLDFSSSIWNTYPYNQVAWLPEKYAPIEDSQTHAITIAGIQLLAFARRGFTNPGYATSAAHTSNDPSIQKGYYNGIMGDFMRGVKKFCNGKFIIPDQTNTLILERRDFYPANTPYQLPDIRQDWNGYNTDELFASIELRFEDDLNDKNCMDKYSGTILETTHQQIVTNDPRKVGLKGLREINIPAARGVRKEKLNFIERTVEDLNIVFKAIADAFILALNACIATINVIIAIINALFALLNLIITIIQGIVSALNAIASFLGLGGAGTITGNFQIPYIPSIPAVPYYSLNPDSYIKRVGALLLENDMVTTPKILLVDTQRSEFTAPGGYSGQQRVAYLHPANINQIHALTQWNDFYFIDAFVGTKNNRFTKIAPATNHASEKNPILLRLADFKNLVSNPKLNDNFAETVIAETIQWYIEKNGRGDIQFRKQGWLKDPQNKNGLKRAKEININLSLSNSLPNGQ